MSNEILNSIQASVTRIEGTLNTFSGQFAQHVADDKEIARAVAQLARQRGFFVTGFLAVGTGIGAAVGYVIKRMFGQH